MLVYFIVIFNNVVIFVDFEKEICFGDSISRFLLVEFLGYDDILMFSIK